MNRNIHRIASRGLFCAICSVAFAWTAFAGSAVFAVPTIPVLWTAGGLSAGTDSAGQAARVAVDPSGNVTVVSGPSMGRDLALTSHTASGEFRWRNAVTPSSGVFLADWVAAAPNGDFVAVGHNISLSSGNSLGITLARFGSDGTFQWRVNLSRILPAVGRLLVDSAGNAYLAFNSVGDGQDIQLHKYSPAGELLWSQTISTGFFSNNIATSLALSPDATDVVVTGNTTGGAEWISALYDAATGARRWLVVAPEGTAVRDAVIDAERVYVTGLGNVGINSFLAVVAYDRASGARLWRTDKVPAGGSGAAGLRMALAPDGSLVVAGQAAFGFLDWYMVALETNGAVRWEAVRDGGLNTNEIPAAVLVLPDGTTVVTGPGGPNLPGGYIGGVTAGYSLAGTPLWEAFSPLATVWAAALPNGDVCATGGYDAFVACWAVPALAGPIVPTNAVSRKTHGAAGTIDVELPLTGTPGVECRNSGGNHTFVFTFSNDIVSGNAAIDAGIGTIAGAPTFSGETMTVNLTGVSDVQTLSIRLSNVTDRFAQVLADTAVQVRMLVGDTSGNGAVNGTDVSQTKAVSGQTLSATNFRCDINANGTINASDLAIVKAQAGTSVISAGVRNGETR